MGWRFKWVSSFNTDFNFDFNVSFTPEQVKSEVLPYNYGKEKMKTDEKQGVRAFYRGKNGDVYHTYSSYERGIDLMNTTYQFLDLTAKGRDKNPDAPQNWVRYHDKYKGASKDLMLGLNVRQIYGQARSLLKYPCIPRESALGRMARRERRAYPHARPPACNRYPRPPLGGL